MRNVIVLDTFLDCEFMHRKVPAIALPQSLGYLLQIIEAHGLAAPLDQDLHREQPTLLQLFIRGNPFRGSAGLNQAAKDWFEFLLAQKTLRGLVIYGSPYILNDFLTQLPDSIPYGFSYGQMPLAQRVLLEQLLPFKS